MIKSVEKFLKKYDLLKEEKTFLVGFSGGYDSICLLDILHKLSLNKNFKVIALHLNHNWRGKEAKLEQKNCENFCNEKGITFYTETLEENAKKTETAAREYRQRFFIKYYKKLKADALFLAHTKTDNTETILYRISKGTGMRGLCGILEHSKLELCEVFRPLMTFSRQDILSYCKENHLPANNDSSNSNTKYARNFIRHKVTTELKKLNPDLDSAIANMSKVAISEQKIIAEYLSKIKENIKKEEGFDTQKFISLSMDVQYRFILDFLIENKIDYDFQRVEKIFTFIQENSRSKAQKTLSVTTDIWLSVSKAKIYPITKIKKQKNETEIIIDGYGKYNFNNSTFIIEEYKKPTTPKFPKETEKIAYINLPNNFDLTIRTRKDGDIIQPFGMSKTTKLKKLFINKGVDKFKRDDIMLLCNKNEVLWAAGVCLSEKIRTKERPTHVIKIEDR